MLIKKSGKIASHPPHTFLFQSLSIYACIRVQSAIYHYWHGRQNNFNSSKIAFQVPKYFVFSTILLIITPNYMYVRSCYKKEVD